MFRYWYFSFKYREYFKNATGIQAFAQRCLGWLIDTTTKAAERFTKRNESLKVEKANLLASKRALEEKPLLHSGERFTVQKTVRRDTFIWLAIFIAEGFLNYVSTLIFIPGEALIFSLLRWAIAIVLTSAGILVCEKLIEAILPIQKYTEKNPAPSLSVPVSLLWLTMFCSVEIAIIGVAETRARDIEGGMRGGILYYGFIVLSAVLPIIGGGALWDRSRYLDAYRRTLEHFKIQRRLTRIESLLRRSEEKLILHYKRTLTNYWAVFSEFRTYKENYNARRSLTEDLSLSFARDYQAFEKEGAKRFESDVRDLTAKGLRKLEKMDVAPGTKLGQAANTEQV